MLFEKRIIIEQEHLSDPYDHVHHAEIIKFLEAARIEYLSSIGFPVEFFFEQNLFLVISALKIKYKREVTKGVFVATCDRVSIDGKKIIIDQSLLNPRGKPAVSAVVESQLLDRAKCFAIIPPQDFLDRLIA